jgi:hypothetical protein
MILDLADLDVIFLTYDEPNKEEAWLKIKNMVPWAKRVDGVKGSDAAHKAAARASDTERFILVDGDNVPDEDFFNKQLDFTDKDPSFYTAQFRWKARNHINGLCYGNGGISSWTKTYVEKMRTHEASDGNPSHTVDFCMDSSDNQYWAMHDCYSTTYPNHSPFQAWRAGFREGVKMCLVNGDLPSVIDFKATVATRNMNNLTIWHNVGLDVQNGAWAIAGARFGTYQVMLGEWDHRRVQSFEVINRLWQMYGDLDPTEEADRMGIILRTKLALPICTLDAEQSRFFKRHQPEVRNRGPLVKEMDVIRKLEGW